MIPASELRVLVVEDHDFQRRTLTRMLHNLGILQVQEAKDGRQALSLIQNTGEVDIIFCDLDMPEMDGMELMRHLAAAKSSASIIICSAQDRSLLASVEKMAHAYQIRLIGVIEKPVTMNQLKDLIALAESVEPELKSPENKITPFTISQILEGLHQNQFEPFFQAKKEFLSGKIIGAEALARWRHPAFGIIEPREFITVLEQSHNIDVLTFIMLEKAGRACWRWLERGDQLTVSVNLSLVSLTDLTFADQITQIIRDIGLEPRHLILEITETAAMTNIASALENLIRLRMHGFGLSIDDYGTGFASIQQLMRIPFTEFKIDRGFVTGCVTNLALRTIVESSVELARRLNIKSVVEGVETRAEWDLLKAMGCNAAQGYYIAKPMDEAQFLQFCASHS